MEAAKAIEILRKLADGIDIDTGEALSPSSQYNRPDAIRALFAGIEALEGKGSASPTPKQEASSDKPPAAGGLWTEEEQAHLVESFESGSDIASLAETHGRSKGAIRSRLRKLGLID